MSSRSLQNSYYYDKPIESLKDLQKKIIENADRSSIIAAYDHLAPLLQETIRSSMEYLSKNAVDQEFAEKVIHWEGESSSSKNAPYFRLFQEAVANVIEAALPPQIQALKELDSLSSLMNVEESPETILDAYSSLSLRAEANIAAAIYDELILTEDLSELKNLGDLRKFAKNKICQEKDFALLKRAAERQISYYSSGWQLDRQLGAPNASLQSSSS